MVFRIDYPCGRYAISAIFLQAFICWSRYFTMPEKGLESIYFFLWDRDGKRLDGLSRRRQGSKGFCHYERASECALDAGRVFRDRL